MKKTNLLLLIFFTSLSLYAQESKRHYPEKGLIILSAIVLSGEDQAKILNYNYDPYRALDKRSKVQIENGPLIELLSVNEIERSGSFVNPSLKKEIQEKSKIKSPYEVIPLVQIGICKNKTKYPAEIEKLVHQ